MTVHKKDGAIHEMTDPGASWIGGRSSDCRCDRRSLHRTAPSHTLREHEWPEPALATSMDALRRGADCPPGDAEHRRRDGVARQRVRLARRGYVARGMPARTRWGLRCLPLPLHTSERRGNCVQRNAAWHVRAAHEARLAQARCPAPSGVSITRTTSLTRLTVSRRISRA